MKSTVSLRSIPEKAVAEGHAVTRSSISNDTVSPVFVSVRTDSAGENVLVTFSEEVFVSPLVRYVSDLFNEPLSPFLRAAMTVTVDGFVDHINQVSISGTELKLGLSLPPAMRAGQEVTVAYDNVFAS